MPGQGKAKAMANPRRSSLASVPDSPRVGSGSRQVALAAVLAIGAGVAAVAFMLLVAPGGGGVGPQAPVGATGDTDPGDDPVDDPVDLGEISVPGTSGNATTGIPLPDVPVP